MNNTQQIDMTGFDFLTEPVEEQGASLAQPRGPNLSKIVKMTPRKFAQSVLEVFEDLGGASWLLTQAKIDPRGFMDLLKRILPRNLQLDGIEGLHISLIDRFGNIVEVDASGRGQVDSPNNVTSGDPPKAEAGHLQIATGGNPITVDIKDKANDLTATPSE